jgi:hypothetical protein
VPSLGELMRMRTGFVMRLLAVVALATAIAVAAPAEHIADALARDLERIRDLPEVNPCV